MNAKEKKFVETVWEYYQRHGRRGLPWRRTKNPYRILVSEIMLQQTQVERVLPKYTSFLKKFPSVSVLARASLGDVLREWQGLGYNRRARMLHLCAQEVTDRRCGRFPSTYHDLVKLPGIGPYTAGAIRAFAYNKPTPVIETNIRSVYLHHFFHDGVGISDSEILKKVEKTLDMGNPREWYYALMDYGVFIKKEFGNPNTRSKHHVRHVSFKGSDREIRGAIVRALSKENISFVELAQILLFDRSRIANQLLSLKEEGMVLFKNGKYQLP